MMVPLDRAILAFSILVPPTLDESAGDPTAKSWFACGDREREAGEQLAALAAYGRAADAALAERKPMAALNAWIEQAQLWAERGQFEELKSLGERLHRFAYAKGERVPAGGLLRATVFAHFVTLAASGRTSPLADLVLDVRAVRLCESTRDAQERLDELRRKRGVFKK